MLQIIYNYQIYDEDIGSIIRDVTFLDKKEMQNTILDDMLSYSGDDYVDDDLQKEDEIFWVPRLIYDSLLNFNYQGGLMEWTCWLPGHHRKLIAKLVKQKI